MKTLCLLWCVLLRKVSIKDWYAIFCILRNWSERTKGYKLAHTGSQKPLNLGAIKESTRLPVRSSVPTYSGESRSSCLSSMLVETGVKLNLYNVAERINGYGNIEII